MSANIPQPSNPNLVPYQNLAPVKPLLELKRGGKRPSTYLQKALAERFQHKMRKDRDPWREIFNVGQLVSLYIDGKQFLAQNPYDGSWGALPITGNDDSSRRALNVMNNLKQNLLTKWEGSNPDILIRGARNVDTAQSAAKAADAINNYYERQFYNHWFSQQEGLMGMIFGTYIDRYRFDDAKVSLSLIQDVFEQKDVSLGEGLGYCASCDYGGNAQEFEALGGDGPLSGPRCPQCGGTAVDVQKPPSDSLYSVSGKETKQVGDLTCELLPLPACRWDLAKRPEDSSWFIYRQRIPKGAVTRVMGNVLLPVGNVEQDVGLDILQALQHPGQPLSGYSSYGNQRKAEDEELDKDGSTTFDEMWLGPEDYADISLIGDEETVEGSKIPKGKLIDYFPDGLCAVGLNSMSVILALYPEKHRNHIVSGTWFMRSQTGAGRGLADSVEIQKQFNTLNNQAMAYMSSTYSPAIMYDNQLMSGSKMKYIGTPKTNIPVDLTKLPEGRKLAEAIHQFQPTAMPNQFFTYAQDFLNVMFQKTSMVTDFANGEPGIAASNTTAAAAEIDQSNADSINQPIFLIKGDARKRGAELTIQLFRQHFPMKRYFDLGGKYGQQQGIELSSADLKGDLVFEVARNSEMPKGPYTRQKNLMSFFGVLGGAEGYVMLQQANPKLASEIEQTFDVDLETDDYDAVAELCRRRLDQMAQAAKGGVQDPAILIQAIQPPISAVELELKQKAEWFAAWLSQDEGQNAPMSLRAAVELLAQGQLQGQNAQDITLAGAQGATQAAAMAPAALGQHALEINAAQQPESTEPDPSAQLQFAQEQSTQQHEAEQNALDREHEASMVDKELAKDKETAKVEADHKIRIEKAKPKKPAAKPSGGKK